MLQTAKEIVHAIGVVRLTTVAGKRRNVAYKWIKRNRFPTDVSLAVLFLAAELRLDMDISTLSINSSHLQGAQHYMRLKGSGKLLTPPKKAGRPKVNA